MILRLWRGLVKPGHAEQYVEFLHREVFPDFEGIQGFVDASLLRREIEAGTEFLVSTTWETIDAIKNFAGADAESAVVPPKARELLVEWDNRARHYDIVG